MHIFTMMMAPMPIRACTTYPCVAHAHASHTRTCTSSTRMQPNVSVSIPDLDLELSRGFWRRASSQRRRFGSLEIDLKDALGALAGGGGW